MKIIIEIECDNAAFGNDPYRELRRILGAIPNKIFTLVNKKRTYTNSDISDALMDINGNSVGKVEVIF